MKPCICSRSLLHLPLRELIDEAATLDVAVELACAEPHLSLRRARQEATQIASEFGDMGVPVAALAFPAQLATAGPEMIDAAAEFIDYCRVFGTHLLKLSTGGPPSSEADDEHYSNLAAAIERLAPRAESRGVCLALEMAPGQISDCPAVVHSILDHGPPEAVGLAVDLCEIVLESQGDPVDTIEAVAARTVYLTAKDAVAPGDWVPIGEGRIDWPRCLTTLSLHGYHGYVAVECPDLDPGHALPAVREDLAAIRHLLAQLNASM